MQDFIVLYSGLHFLLYFSGQLRRSWHFFSCLVGPMCVDAYEVRPSTQVLVLCLFCFLQSQMPDPKTYRQHFESKHPKSPLPAEIVDAPSA